MLDRLTVRAKDIGINLNISPEVALAVVKKCTSTHKDSGARHLRREITESIEFPLSRKILCDKSKEWIVCADGEDIRIQSVTNRIAAMSAE